MTAQAPSPSRPGGPAAVWVLLSLGTVAALCTTEFLPFYDYYQWLFQGRVVSVLLFGADAASRALAAGYVLSPVPVPNLAAPGIIGLLNAVLPIEAAGQVFVVVTVLGLGGAYGHLVRTVQGRPTAVEYLGLPWALGFFLYKGYLSYAFGLAWVFVLVALLHRLHGRAAPPRRRTLLAVGGLGVVLYLSHLLAWLMGGLAVLVYAAALARRGRRRTAAQLVACMAPGVVLAVWYLLVERGGSGTALYASWQEKAVALTETLQLFLRLDPFPPAFPLFWVNAVLALAFGALVLFPLDARRLRAAVADRPLLGLGLALAAVALLLPISTVNDLIKPDERFVLPALLLVSAGLPHRPVGRRPAAVGAAFAAVVVALHLVEYADVGTRIGRVDAAIDAAVPPGADVLHLVVPARYGCGPAAEPVTGVPVLKWFAVDHALEGGPPLVDVEETSLVHARRAAAPRTTVVALDVPEVPAAVLAGASTYPVVEAVACPADLAAVERAIAPRYRAAVRGDGFAVFRRL